MIQCLYRHPATITLLDISVSSEQCLDDLHVLTCCRNTDGTITLSPRTTVPSLSTESSFRTTKYGLMSSETCLLDGQPLTIN